MKFWIKVYKTIGVTRESSPVAILLLFEVSFFFFFFLEENEGVLRGKSFTTVFTGYNGDGI